MQTSSRPSLITASGSTCIPPPYERPLPTTTSIASSSIRSLVDRDLVGGGRRTAQRLQDGGDVRAGGAELHRHRVRRLVHLRVEPGAGDVHEAPARRAGGDLDDVQVARSRARRGAGSRRRASPAPIAFAKSSPVPAGSGGERRAASPGARSPRARRCRRRRAPPRSRAPSGRLPREPLEVGRRLRDADLVGDPERLQRRGRPSRSACPPSRDPPRGSRRRRGQRASGPCGLRARQPGAGCAVEPGGVSASVWWIWNRADAAWRAPGARSPVAMTALDRPRRGASAATADQRRHTA